MIFEFIIFALSLALAIAIHEAAHCYMADYLGDPTPRSLGRLTLNPIAHLDPIGFGMPFLLFLLGSPIMFGWGKSAPFDPYNLRNPKIDTLKIALAGPASNLILAILLSLVLHLVPASSQLLTISHIFISINLSLALFNLLPIPPLDGSKIFLGRYESFTRRNPYLLLLLLLLPIFGGQSLASVLISPLYHLLSSLLLPGL